MLSLSSASLLNSIMGRSDPYAVTLLPSAAGPTLVRISAPPEDIVEDMVELLDEASPEGRRRNRYLSRRRGTEGLALDDQGHPTLHGRACCLELARRLDSQIQFVQMGARFICTCKAVYAIELRVREERPHGR